MCQKVGSIREMDEEVWDLGRLEERWNRAINSRMKGQLKTDGAEEPTLMLGANNTRFHFREQRGQHYLLPLASRHCLLCASEWFSSLLLLLSTPASTRKQSGLVWPAQTWQIKAHCHRKSVVCLQISLMKQYNFFPLLTPLALRCVANRSDGCLFSRG